MTAIARKSSGQHPKVRAFRAKLASIAEGTLPMVKNLNARIDRMRERSSPAPSPPSRDPRREPVTSSAPPETDSDFAVDVVVLPSEDDGPG